MLRIALRNQNITIMTRLKSFRLKLIILAFVLLSGTLFSASCEKNNDTVPVVSCNVKGIIRHNLCGIGVWGGFVIELENGEIIQPWSAANKDIENFKPQVNQNIMLAFTVSERDNRYDNTIRCLAVGEYEGKINKVVRIDCLTASNK